MRHLLLSLIALFVWGAPDVPGQELEVPRVIVIGIDGLGSENVWRDTYRGVPPPLIPNIDQLKNGGAYTLRAGIDSLNFSGPNWVGMITGSMSSEHGVDSNGCTRGAALPTIYEHLRNAFRPYWLARQHQLAVVHEWPNIACHYDPSAVNLRVNTGDERETADWVINLIGYESIIFTFVDFGGLDAAGHQFGGNTIEYKEKVEAIDTEIGRILTAIADSPRADQTYVILTADHGHLRDGGGHSPANAPVPFIVVGPDVIPGELGAGVRNNQVAPLVAHILGVAPNPLWSAPLAPFDSVIHRPSVIGIEVTGPRSNAVNVGSEGLFRAFASFSNSTSRNVSLVSSWSSSDEAVFTVTPAGWGTATGAGSAEICATYAGVVGCFAITVAEAAQPSGRSRVP